MDQSGLAPIWRWSLIALIVLLVYMGLFAKRGWFDWHRLVQQNNELAARIDLERDKLEGLQQRISALRTNRMEQERLVREVLGYVRLNETVVEFEQ